MTLRKARWWILGLGLSAGVALGQDPSPTFPPLPPLQPVMPPAPVAPSSPTPGPPAVVVPAGGPTESIQIPTPTPTPPTPPSTLPPTTTTPPTVAIAPETKPAVVVPAVPTPSVKPTPPVKAVVHLSPAPSDATNKYETMIAESKAAFAKLRDYSCHVKKQDRVNGKILPEQTAELHVSAKPLSMYVKFLGPKEQAGMEAVFVDGKYPGNMKLRVKPNGVAGIAGFQTMSFEDSRLTSITRRPFDKLGIGATLDLAEKVVAVEKRLNNPVEITTAEYTFANRAVTRFDVMCDRPHAHRTGQRVVVYFDKETKLPVRFEAYDSPKVAGEPFGELLESVSYVNIKANVGHTATVFER